MRTEKKELSKLFILYLSLNRGARFQFKEFEFSGPHSDMQSAEFTNHSAYSLTASSPGENQTQMKIQVIAGTSVKT